MGVGQRLLRGEGLGGDDEQGGFGIEPGQGVRDVVGIHVGHEVHPKRRGGIGPERLAGHARPQVRTADADVHHVRDPPTGPAGPLAAPHGLGKAPHPGEHRIDPEHHVLAVDQDRGVGPVPQGHVKHGTALREVDPLAPEHAFAPARHVGLARQVEQEPQRLGRDAIL